MPIDAPAVDDLIRAIARDRDIKSFEALFALYAPRLQRYYTRLGADTGQSEEWIQEVMLSIWKKAHTYDASRAAGSTWIYTIARNKRIDAIRRQVSADRASRFDATFEDGSDVDLDQWVDAKRRASRVRGAIDQLAPEQADIIRRVYFAGEPRQRVAEQTGAPVGTVKSRLRLALGHLRRVLKSAEDDS